MTSTQQASVDTFLEDVILNAVDRTADAQARAEVRLVADSINDAAARIEATYRIFY